MTMPVVSRWLNAARARRAERRREIAERYRREWLACEDFIGSRSPNPVISAYHRERARLALLHTLDMSEEYRQQLRDEGPRCTPEQWQEATAIYAEAASRRAEEAETGRLSMLWGRVRGHNRKQSTPKAEPAAVSR